MAFSASPSSISADINVTPLIDVLLVLVILFMVIAPVASRGLESEVPQGKAPSEASTMPIEIEVLEGLDGRSPRYRVAHQEIAYEGVKPRLEAMLAARQDRTVFLRAARGLSYQHVAEVVSEAQRAGAAGVVLDDGK